MLGRLHRFLADDHDRLEEFLKQLARQADLADDPAFLEFRQGLLRHIAMKEKVLIPFAREKRGGESLPIAARIRSDHGALAALVAPTPTAQVLETIRTILEAHNPVEEHNLETPGFSQESPLTRGPGLSQDISQEDMTLDLKAAVRASLVVSMAEMNRVESRRLLARAQPVAQTSQQQASDQTLNGETHSNS